MNSSLSDRVYGGENVPYSLLPFLVLIRTIIPPNNVAICTGTLIGTNPSNSYVLTAKHCVDTQVSNYRRSFHLCGQVNPCPGGCGANYGYRNSKRAASNAFGDPEIFFFNDIIAARPSNYNRQLPDIAVVKLENLNNFPSVSCHSYADISSIALSNSQFVNVAGYGIDSIGNPSPGFINNGGVLRQVQTQISSRDISTPEYTPPGYAQVETYIMTNRVEGTRHGDSGGPVLSLNSNTVIGVHSWVSGGSVIETTGHVSVTDPNINSWINSIVYNVMPPTPPPLQPITTPQNPPPPPEIPPPNSPPKSPPDQVINETLNLSVFYIFLSVFLIVIIIISLVILFMNQNI